MYFSSLPPDLRETVNGILEAERKISEGLSKPYNDYVASSESATSVSASGRVMAGYEAVCKATETVAQGNTSEHGRFLDEIACACGEDLAYVVFRSGVTIQKSDGTESTLCWVITLVLQRFDGQWKLIHRQNTRSPEKT